MKKSAKSILVASMLALATATSAYAVEKAHEKSSVSQYVDDASITANIKASPPSVSKPRMVWCSCPASPRRQPSGCVLRRSPSRSTA